MARALIMLGCGAAVAVLAAIAEAATGFCLYRARLKATRIRERRS